MFMLNVENKLLKKIVNLSFVIDEAVGDFDSRIWIISPIAAWLSLLWKQFHEN